MNPRHFLTPSPWMHFSKKVHSRILQPLYNGSFHPEESSSSEMRVVLGSQGNVGEVRVRLFWLVDESDGIIADARFEAFGPPALIAAADLACEVVIRKNYEQARRVSAEIIDH